jgi:uncharacterized protein
MDDVTITSHDSGTSGEYRAQVAGSSHIGRLSWVRRGTVRVAEHTLVPPEIGGRGVAALLVAALMSDAREHGFTVDPQCSYVAAALRKHPEWSDLQA